MPLNPDSVKWKFFSRDSDGKIIASDSAPEGERIVALINSSTFPVEKSATPKHIKAKIEEVFKYKNAADLCFAVPCEDVAVMRKYYGEANVADVEDDYVCLRMHDDLREGNPTFSPHKARFEKTMPAKEGAEQIASAIENGFDVWSYNSGGNSIVPKLELCEEYFAKNFDRLRQEGKLQREVKFIGFSNGTAMAFHLRGLVDYTLGYGLSYSVHRIQDFAVEDIGAGSLKDQTDQLLRSFKGEDVEVVRKFGSVVSGSFADIKTRYEEAIKSNFPITNIAVWLGQMVPATMGKLPNFGNDEKVILELEYSMHHPPEGYEASNALRRFLESGAIKAENILYIALGDFMEHTEENIPRKHGLIPDLNKLSNKEIKEIERIARQKDLSAEAYILQSNTRSQELMEEVKAVAAEYKIPVIEGGERRVSHGKYSQLAPSKVAKLEFHEADSSVTQTCLLQANAEVCRDLIVTPHKMATHSGSVNSDIETVGSIIDSAKIIPLTSSAKSFKLGAAEEIVAGMPIDLATIDPKQIAGKGVVVYLPMVERSISPSEQFNAFQLSQNYKNAKFVVVVTPLPEYEKEEKEMIEDRNNNYRKLIDDLDTSEAKAPPVFISTNSVKIEYFPPFSHVVNLERMSSEEPRSSVEAPIRRVKMLLGQLNPEKPRSSV